MLQVFCAHTTLHVEIWCVWMHECLLLRTASSGDSRISVVPLVVKGASVAGERGGERGEREGERERGNRGRERGRERGEREGGERGGRERGEREGGERGGREGGGGGGGGGGGREGGRRDGVNLAKTYGGPLVQFSRFASSSSFRLFPAFFFCFFFFFFFFFCFHFLPQLFSTFSPSFLSRPRFRGAPSIIWINYAHALYSGRRGSDVEESPYGTGESVLTRGQ